MKETKTERRKIKGKKKGGRKERRAGRKKKEGRKRGGYVDIRQI